MKKNCCAYLTQKLGFSLVEMLMALLVASLLLAALAPVMTRRMNENLHITGEFSHNGKNETVEISYGHSKYCPNIVKDENGNELYCEGEYVVPEGYNNITVTAIGAGGGGGAAPTAGYMEFTNSGSTNTFTVPAMVNQLEATLISGGAGGGAGGQAEVNYEKKEAGEYTWNVPEIARGKNVLITACGAGGGAGGNTGTGHNCETTKSEYLSNTHSGAGGGGGYITKAITLANTGSQHVIIGGGGGGGARGTTVAAATGNSGSYGGGGGGGADPWGGGGGYGGSGGAAGGAGGTSRGSAIGSGLGGGRGDTSSSTDGADGIRGSISQGGTGSSTGGTSPAYTDTRLEYYTKNDALLGTGGGGGGGSITGHGGGGGGGGAGYGGGGGGGGATIFGTRNNRIVVAPGGGGGGGGGIDDYDYDGTFVSLGLGRWVWTYKDNAWVKLYRIAEEKYNPRSYASGGGGGGGGGEGGGGGGGGGRAHVDQASAGENGANYSASTIFGTNNCNGGAGIWAKNYTCPTQGGDGKPGAIRITYLDYGPGGSGGGSGQMVPIQPIHVAQNEELNIKLGIGASGGKAGQINLSGTIVAAERGNGREGSENWDIESAIYRDTTRILTTIPGGKVYGVGTCGGSPTGQSYGLSGEPFYGCQGWITDGVTYNYLNNNYRTLGFVTNYGHTAGNGTTLGNIIYANKTTGGDGGATTVFGKTICSGGTGGTADKPKGGDASGYGGCGGGGGYGLHDGGRGSGGYARLSWNMYWDTALNSGKGDYKYAETGAGGGGASGNTITETVRVKTGQIIKIRIGAGGIGAKVSNNTIIPATEGGITIFGDTNFIEIKAGGGGGGKSPDVIQNGNTTTLINGKGGEPSKICDVGSSHYINNKNRCTKGKPGNTPGDNNTSPAIGGFGADYSLSLNNKTYRGTGGAGGTQSTGMNNSKGKTPEDSHIAAGGGGSALLIYNKIANLSELNHPQGGNGAPGKIILQLWE